MGGPTARQEAQTSQNRLGSWRTLAIAIALGSYPCCLAKGECNGALPENSFAASNAPADARARASDTRMSTPPLSAS